MRIDRDSGRVVNGIARPDWEIELPRGVREFMPAFGSPFQSGFASSGAVVVPHWSTLNGTIADSLIAAWTPYGAASQAVSYVQYGGLGTGLTVGTAPAWDAVNGWKFVAASSQYLKSGVVPADGNYSLFIQFSNHAAVDATIMAQCSDGTHYFGVAVFGTSNVNYYDNGGALAVAPKLLSGNLGVAGQQGYRNGTADGGAIPSPATTAKEIYFGARNANGTALYFATVYIQRAVIYKLVLTGPQVATLAAAMAAL